MTHGMNAFFANPGQWELFKRARPETAVDEVIRWATPAQHRQASRTPAAEVGMDQRRQGTGGLLPRTVKYCRRIRD